MRDPIFYLHRRAGKRSVRSRTLRNRKCNLQGEKKKMIKVFGVFCSILAGMIIGRVIAKSIDKMIEKRRYEKDDWHL